MEIFSVSQKKITEGIPVSQFGLGGWQFFFNGNVINVTKSAENMITQKKPIIKNEKRLGYTGRLLKAGIMPLKDRYGSPTGRFLLIPEERPESEVLVSWLIFSGNDGEAHIEPSQLVRTINWHRGQNHGHTHRVETMSYLSILKPRQGLTALITVPAKQWLIEGSLHYEYGKIHVCFKKNDCKMLSPQ